MCYDRRRAEACVDESAHHESRGIESVVLVGHFCGKDRIVKYLGGS